MNFLVRGGFFEARLEPVWLEKMTTRSDNKLTVKEYVSSVPPEQAASSKVAISDKTFIEVDHSHTLPQSANRLVLSVRERT